MIRIEAVIRGAQKKIFFFNIFFIRSIFILFKSEVAIIKKELNLLFKKFTRIWYPQAFQGTEKKKNYFEGWYFKIIDPEQNLKLALIPGVFFSRNPNQSQSFIQVLNGNQSTNSFISFPKDDFKASNNNYLAEISNNTFSEKEINIKIDRKELKFECQVQLDNHHPWPVTLFTPGAMGWYRFVPFMQCYHGVVSMGCKVNGEIMIDGKLINISNASGYIEKDWGKAFPEAYIWLQNNCFKEEETSIMLSIATIPWLGKSFNGFIVGFLHKGKLYRFTTYNHSKLSTLKLDGDKFHIILTNKKYSLEINGKLDKQQSAILHAPYTSNKGEMIPRVAESMSGEIEVKFYSNNYNRELLFHETNEHTSIEAHGNIEKLTK